MRRLGWLLHAMRKPVEASMFVYSTGLLFLSLYILSPWYAPSAGSSFSTFDGRRVAELCVAGFLLLLSLPGVIQPFVHEDQKEKWLKRATFNIFLGFFFLFLLRVIVAGWTPVIWLYPLLISLSSGIKRIFVGVRKE